MQKSILFLAVTVMQLATALTAQAQTVVPIDQEPKHRLVFQNQVVRLFDVQLPPGYLSLYHWHEHDGVFVNLATSATTAQELGKELVRRGPREIGQTYYLAYGETPTVHQVANVGTVPYRVMDAEVIGACSVAPLPGDGSPEPVVDNAKVEVVRWRLAPGQSVILGKACALLIAVEPAQLLIDEGRGTLAADWEKGSYGWRNAQSEWSVANRGVSATHLVEIRFK